MLKKSLFVFALTITAAAQAQTPRAIFTNVAGQPTAIPPNGTGNSFVVSSQGFNPLSVSEDGRLWVISITVNDGVNTSKDVVFSGNRANPSTIQTHFVEGTPFFADSTKMITSAGIQGAINDNGEMTQILRISTGRNVLVKAARGASPTLVLSEADTIPGVGINVGNIDSVFSITPNGASRFRGFASNLSGAFFARVAATGTNTALTFPFTPTGQAFSPARIAEPILFNGRQGSRIGAPYHATVSLTGAPANQDTALIFDQQVMFQEGAGIDPVADPGSRGFATSMSADGNVWATLVPRQTVDEIASSRGILASRFGPVANDLPGVTWDRSPGEFGRTFNGHAINAYGDFVIAGGASIGGPLLNVVSFNGWQTLIKNGDAMDVSGDGVPEPGYTFGSVRPETLVLTDSNVLYFNAIFAGGRGVYRMVLPLTGDIDDDNEVGPSDLQTVLDEFGETGQGDVDRDGEVGPGDLQIVLDHFGRSRTL